jgi:hypothetical protein
MFYNPGGIAWYGLAASGVFPASALLIADKGTHRLRLMSGTGIYPVTTLAGSSSGWADGVGTAARFSSPVAVATGAVGGTAPLKNGFSLPRAPVANADLARLINSAEIQAVVRPALLGKSRHARQKKNPLRNFKAMLKLNPYAATIRKAEAARKAACAVAAEAPRAMLALV